jgi:hypothetical protein
MLSVSLLTVSKPACVKFGLAVSQYLGRAGALPSSHWLVVYEGIMLAF